MQPGTSPPPQSNSGRTLLIVLGTIGALVVVCCGACGGITYFGMRTAMADEAKRVAVQVNQHPKIQEKIGTIDEIQWNMAASLNADGDAKVFDIRGANGSGQLIVEELFYTYVSIKLKTADGEWELLEAPAEEEGVVEAEEMATP